MIAFPCVVRYHPEEDVSFPIKPYSNSLQEYHKPIKNASENSHSFTVIYVLASCDNLSRIFHKKELTSKSLIVIVFK